jgi:UPF0755 protein
MNKVLRYFYITVAAVAAVLIVACIFYRHAIAEPASKKAQEVNFTISAGQGAGDIAQDLKEQGLLRSELIFKTYVWGGGRDKSFKAGRYSLNTNMSVKEIVDKITSGETLKQVETIKIIEGWHLNKIAGYLEDKELFSGEDFLDITGHPLVDYRNNRDLPKPADFSATFDFLRSKPAYYGLEGYLFPDTYEVYKNVSPSNVVVKMLSNFDKKVTDDMRADIQQQGKTLHEIVTMASLLEKEVQTEEEMKIVSGIFWDKIDRGEPLRSCATLAYILGEDKPRYTIADTEIDSPFNTYQNPGLPPSPVGNPGLKAIKAAIYPTETDYNYFLSPLGSDSTVFSKTWEEHLRNKRLYLD